MASADVELKKQIKEAGKQLLYPPDSVDELVLVLDQVEKFLLKVDQSPEKSMLDVLGPLMKALIHDNLSKHSDVDVKVAVASCISQITRITAPDEPYNQKQMRDVFRLVVSSFEGLADQSSRSYTKRVSILETVFELRSCVIMLDLESDDLIVKMFEYFLNSVRDYHLHSIFSLMESIMVLVLEESDNISVEMLKPLLASVKKDQTGVLPVARKLAEGVFLESANTIKPYLIKALKSLGESFDIYTKVVTSACEGTTAIFENNHENTSEIQAANEIKSGNVEASVDQKSKKPEEVKIEKDSHVQVSLSKAVEIKLAATATVSSPYQRNNLHEEKPVRSKKKRVPQEDKTASPSNGGSHKKTKITSLTRDVTPEAKGAEKKMKTVIAKEIAPIAVNGLTLSEALKKFNSKLKSTEQSGEKSNHSNQSCKKVDAKEEDNGIWKRLKDNLIVEYDESLVDTKVKVWWAVDKMYYEGVIDDFNPDNMRHKVLYLDGYIEWLNLRVEKWKVLKKFSSRDNKEQTTKAQSKEASPETHKKKKPKTNPAPSASQEKVKDSVNKRVGGPSSRSAFDVVTPAIQQPTTTPYRPETIGRAAVTPMRIPADIPDIGFQFSEWREVLGVPQPTQPPPPSIPRARRDNTDPGVRDTTRRLQRLEDLAMWQAQSMITFASHLGVMLPPPPLPRQDDDPDGGDDM